MGRHCYNVGGLANGCELACALQEAWNLAAAHFRILTNICCGMHHNRMKLIVLKKKVLDSSFKLCV